MNSLSVTFNNQGHSGIVQIFFDNDAFISECNSWHIAGSMRAALPKVLRFCCCAGIIYLGYTFCGWIVLGPYHKKYENLNRVSKCLFSLVNGDNMFATFAQIRKKSTLVWHFSRVHLYSFIALVIYKVLSLFIALITDSYETVKKYQHNGFPMTDLHRFIKECKDFPSNSCREEET